MNEPSKWTATLVVILLLPAMALTILALTPFYIIHKITGWPSWWDGNDDSVAWRVE